MAILTISITEDHMQLLRERAVRYSVRLEDLVRIGIEDIMSRPEKEFSEALQFVLHKNAEIYQRLA
jgi:hypothetical protein